MQQNTSLIYLIANADIVVQLTMLLLLIFSIYSWAIIFDKLLILKKAKTANAKFVNFLSKNKNSPEIVEAIKATSSNSVLEKIFLLSQTAKQGDVYLKTMLYKNQTISKFASKLNYLAIISSSAPFIGLFGTVWGIMHSFQSIAATKNTSLAVVAPGIAEALLATGLGLIAAIPALIFYNILSHKINLLQEQLEDFIAQVTAE